MGNIVKKAGYSTLLLDSITEHKESTTKPFFSHPMATKKIFSITSFTQSILLASTPLLCSLEWIPCTSHSFFTSGVHTAASPWQTPSACPMTVDVHRRLLSGLFAWTAHKHCSTVPNLGHQVFRFLLSANPTYPVLAKFLILHSSSFQSKSLPSWSSLDSASWINPATQCHIQSHAWPCLYALSLTR